MSRISWMSPVSWMSRVPWMLRVLRVPPARARVGREGCSRFWWQRGEREPREQQMVLCRQQEPTAPPHPKSSLAYAQPRLPARAVGCPVPTRRSPPGWQRGVAQGHVGMAGRVPGDVGWRVPSPGNGTAQGQRRAVVPGVSEQGAVQGAVLVAAVHGGSVPCWWQQRVQGRAVQSSVQKPL